MDEEYNISSVDKPDDSVWEVVGGGIRNYNLQQAGESGHKELFVVLRAPDQKIVGGLIGATYCGWLHIDLLFVNEELRGRGYGQRLLEIAEDEARKRGVKNVYLDTFSFQAPDFYNKHGYHVFGELKDFPPGHQRYFFTKQLL
jgi:GNAT superfamily N-acetyltransferase